MSWVLLCTEHRVSFVASFHLYLCFSLAHIYRSSTSSVLLPPFTAVYALALLAQIQHTVTSPLSLTRSAPSLPPVESTLIGRACQSSSRPVDGNESSSGNSHLFGETRRLLPVPSSRTSPTGQAAGVPSKNTRTKQVERTASTGKPSLQTRWEPLPTVPARLQGSPRRPKYTKQASSQQRRRPPHFAISSHVEAGGLEVFVSPRPSSASSSATH